MEENSFQVTEGNPLVSIIVITYNSSKYVLETLESAKAQTYKNIELIVSDDCSTDNTVEICRKWIEENKERFVRTELITFERNTGIAPNCNRGLFAAQGEWVKYIAGDDILLNNCIEDFVRFIETTPECKIVFGKQKILVNGKIIEQDIPKFFKVDKEKQFEMVYTGSSIPAPANFIKRNLLLKVKGFDEDYPFIEDVPMWIKIANEGEFFYSLDMFVVVYRLHDENINRSSSTQFINKLFYYSKKKHIINHIIPYLKNKKKYFLLFHIYNNIFVSDVIVMTGNRNNFLSILLNLMIFKSTVKRAHNLIKKLFI